MFIGVLNSTAVNNLQQERLSRPWEEAAFINKISSPCEASRSRSPPFPRCLTPHQAFLRAFPPLSPAILVAKSFHSSPSVSLLLSTNGDLHSHRWHGPRLFWRAMPLALSEMWDLFFQEHPGNVPGTWEGDGSPRGVRNHPRGQNTPGSLGCTRGPGPPSSLPVHGHPQPDSSPRPDPPDGLLRGAGFGDQQMLWEPPWAFRAL